jgi:hypothetical protein
LQNSLEGPERERAAVFTLDPTGLDQALKCAPTPGKEVQITCPVGGKLEKFRVWPSGLIPTFPRHPSRIRTYAGQGIDDPAATIRLEQTGTRFHFMVLSARGATFVDPKTPSAREKTYFVLPRGRELARGTRSWRCHQSEPAGAATDPPKGSPKPVDAFPMSFSSDGYLRTYRLAVAATSGYVRARGGKSQALESLVTTFNRVDGIFMRDLCIHLELVDPDGFLLFSEPEKDPYAGHGLDDLPQVNQSTLARLVRLQNYDVGHLLCTENGGKALIGCASPRGQKAWGVTGLPWSEGCAADVDFVAHELAHQFGAHHTHNSLLGPHQADSRYAATAVEPGSGSTLMSLAGQCGAENLQAHPDEYFHSVSLSEIARLTSQTPAAHNWRVGQAPSLFPVTGAAIPHSTPFYLSAAPRQPTPANWTFTWEQVDVGAGSPPAKDDGQRPLFRSRPPAAETTRSLPSLQSVLYNKWKVGEEPGMVTRNLLFRLTARNNQATGGSMAYHTITLNLTDAAGPFAVWEPKSGAVWKAGSWQTVLWNCAKTSGPPVGCSQVRLELSLDNGRSFRSLGSAVSNNGAATIRIPKDAASQAARIRVVAVDGLFYQVSPLSFVIPPSPVKTAVSPRPGRSGASAAKRRSRSFGAAARSRSRGAARRSGSRRGA